MKNKLYVLIDKNLDPIYGSVQGGHAVADWLLYEYEVSFEDEPIENIEENNIEEVINEETKEKEQSHFINL